MVNFKNATVIALGWSFGIKVITQFLSIFFGILLARLLDPADFGMIAMPLVFTGLASLFGDLGLGAALIQREEVENKDYSSVFWFNLGIACFMSIIFIYSANFIADFYNEPSLEQIVQILSINFSISALALVPRIQLNKDLKFKELGIIDLSAMIIANFVGITFAFYGAQVWSLVVLNIGIQLFGTILMLFHSNWRPSFIFDFSSIAKMFNFSFYVFLMNTLRYVAVSTDKLLLGKFIGKLDLGYYDKAYSMMLSPISVVSHSVGSVLFPSLSSIQNDIELVRKVYIKTLGSVSYITFPLLMGMVAVSDSFVLGVLGPKWEPIIYLLRIFCAIGIILSIVTLNGSIYLSQGKSKLQLKVNFLTQSVQILFITIGANWGIDGVITGFVISNIFSAIVTWNVAGKIINLKLLTILKTLLPSFLISSTMAFIVWLFGYLYHDSFSIILMLSIQIVIGCIFYLTAIYFIKPAIVVEMFDIAKNIYFKKNL